jgi:glutaredoxin
MKNIKKYWPAVLISIALIFIIAFVMAKKPAAVEAPTDDYSQPSMILFSSEDCPHCQNVKKYLDNNQVRDRIKFQEIEISQNKENEKLFIEKSLACGGSLERGLTIPFLFDDNGLCLTNENNIIQYFENQSYDQ